MSTLTPPIASIPIGYINVQGRRLEVQTHPEFVRYVESLFLRGGGVTGPSTTELAASQFEDAGIEELKSELYKLADVLLSGPNEISELRAQVAELQKTIDGMRQGVEL